MRDSFSEEEEDEELIQNYKLKFLTIAIMWARVSFSILLPLHYVHIIVLIYVHFVLLYTTFLSTFSYFFFELKQNDAVHIFAFSASAKTFVWVEKEEITICSKKANFFNTTHSIYSVHLPPSVVHRTFMCMPCTSAFLKFHIYCQALDEVIVNVQANVQGRK